MKNKQKGLAAVELIIGLPVLMLFLVAVIEIARIYVEMNTLNKAVRVGARYAMSVSEMSGCGPVMNEQGDIKQLVVYGTLEAGAAARIDSLTTNDVTVSCENNQFVTVTASHTFVPLFRDTLPNSELSLALPMNATTVMRLDP
ncbi:pilus assembly protein [Vibrio aquaticus]|uniref:Pilus assembly protein n=1 Tax=Vibrio aquaticus TaxID=2496559 RepID=A0A432CZI6_9VIBR|nr:pilus assembly protein [Vibrio aquaticus]